MEKYGQKYHGMNRRGIRDAFNGKRQTVFVKKVTEGEVKFRPKGHLCPNGQAGPHDINGSSRRNRPMFSSRLRIRRFDMQPDGKAFADCSGAVEFSSYPRLVATDRQIDGSRQFLSENTNAATLEALTTRKSFDPIWAIS